MKGKSSTGFIEGEEGRMKEKKNERKKWHMKEVRLKLKVKVDTLSQL